MDSKELEQLLKVYHKDAFYWARQCCHYDSEEAKEVLQIVYLKILEGKAKFGGKSNFKTWLFSVIRFTSIDSLKKKSSFESLDNLSLVDNDSFQENVIHYEHLLEKLSERQHKVLLLSFYHGMPLSEIAEVMNLHIGTVRTHYERGKASLKQIIEKEQNER